MRHSPSGSSRLNPFVLFGAVFALLGVSLVPSLHAQAPGARPAGKITALIPQDFITRGPQRVEAAKDASVFWNDVIETGRGGRIRVNLLDGSILNIGSQAKMTIRQHDEVSQQTSLELSYGKVRASVVKLAQPGSKFEVKTSQAVCGVVGTDEYLDSNPNSTQVISLFGRIVVGSSDPNLPGTETLDTGELTDVFTGQAPRPKRRATDEELSQAIQDTVTGLLGEITTLSGVQGQTLEAVLVGRNLTPATGVSITGEGVTVTLRSGTTSTRVPLTITINRNAPSGTRQITLQTPRGEVSAAFIVRTTTEGMGLRAVITGKWWYRPDAPPLDVTPPNLDLTRGAQVLLDASPSTGPISRYAWEIQGTRLQSDAATFDIDTSKVPPGSHRISLRVSGPGGTTAQTELSLSVRAIPNPDDVLRGLQNAYETLQINQFMSFFDQERFRAYPALEENMRNALQDLSEIRVYLRIDNRQVLGDDATYQARFEISFSTKADPGRIQTRSETITLRLKLLRDLQGEAWRIADYATVTSPISGSIVAVGTGTGSTIFGLDANSGSPDFTLAIDSTTLVLPGSTLRIGVASKFNFEDSVQITVEGLPPGVSATSTTLRPRATGEPASGRIEITTSANTIPQTAVVRVVARSGPLEHSAALTLQITSFQLSLTSSSIEVPLGSSSSVDVTVIGQNGFNQPVVVTVENLPAGVGVNRLSLSGSTGPLTFSAGCGVTPQRATVNVVGTDATGQIRRVGSLELRLTSFRLAVTPSSSSGEPMDLVIGRSVNFTLSLSPADPAVGFSGTVSVAPQLPAGIFSSPTSANLNAGQSQTFVFTANNSAVGLREIPFRGTVGSCSTSVSAFVNVRGDFDLASSPATSSDSPAALLRGGSASIQVDVIGRNGFTGTVDLTLEPLPSGISANPTATTIAAGSSATFVFSAVPTVPTGPVQVSVRGSVGTTVKTLVIFLNVVDFDLASFPATNRDSPATLLRGGSTSIRVDVIGRNGFTGLVELALSRLPPEISADPTGATVATGGSATFVFSASTSAPLGILQLTAHGRVGTSEKTLDIFLDVRPLPNFNLVVNPATSAGSPLELVTGDSVSFSVSLEPLPGFSGSVEVTVDPVAGLSIDPPRATLTVGSSVSFRVGASVQASLQTLQLTIRGRSGTLERAASLFLKIVSFRLVITPPTSADLPARLSPGERAPFTVRLEALNGFTGSAAITVQEPSEVTANVTSTSLNAGGSFTLILIAGAPARLQQVIVRARRGTFETTASAFLIITAPHVPRGVSLFVSGAGDSASNPLAVLQGCSSTFPGPAAQLDIVATGTGDTVYVSCSANTPTGVSLGAEVCPVPLVPNGSSETMFVDATGLAQLGASSFTLNGFATPSQDSSVIATVTVFINIVAPECAQAPLGDSLSASKGSSPGPAGTGTAAGRTLFPSNVDMKERTAAPTIVRVEPDRAVPGELTQAVIVGQNLATTRTLRVNGEAIAVAMKGWPQDDRVVLELRLSDAATPGTYLLTVEGAGGSASALLTVLPKPRAARDDATSEAAVRGQDEALDAPRSGVDRTVLREPRVPQAGSADLPDLVVSRDEISISPTMPRAGDTVTFRVPVRNEGLAAALDVAVEFSIPDANLAARETISLGPGRWTALVFEWPSARATTGRGVEPRVVVDPDNRLLEVTKQNNVVRLARLLVEGEPALAGREAGVPAAIRASSGDPALRAHADRTTVELALGECTALRLSGGATSACGAAADLELRLSEDGATIALAADAVRPLAAATLEQVTAVEPDGGAREVPVEVGRVYGVNSRGQVAAVRVRSVRGLDQARAERAARPPAALDSPRAVRRLEDDLAEVRGRVKTGKRVLVELEWLWLPEKR